MIARRIATSPWHWWTWIGVGLLMSAILLLFATQYAGGSTLAEEEPLPVSVICLSDGLFTAGQYFGDEPFVQVGSRVVPSTIVGVVNGLRTYPQHAGVSGTIVEVLVGEGEMVFVGQPLFLVQPDEEL